MFKIQPRQPIHTRYLPCTETKPSRVTAVIGSGARSIILPWNDSVSVEENHEIAAFDLCMEMGWDAQAEWVGSSSQDGRGFTFVNVVR